jgi:hypothetical protein
MRKTKRGGRKLNKSRKIYGGGDFGRKKAIIKNILKNTKNSKTTVKYNMSFKISEQNLYENNTSTNKKSFKIPIAINKVGIGTFSVTFNIEFQVYYNNEDFLKNFLDKTHYDNSKDVVIWEPDKYFGSSQDRDRNLAREFWETVKFEEAPYVAPFPANSSNASAAPLPANSSNASATPPRRDAISPSVSTPPVASDFPAATSNSSYTPPRRDAIAYASTSVSTPPIASDFPAATSNSSATPLRRSAIAYAPAQFQFSAHNNPNSFTFGNSLRSLPAPTAPTRLSAPNALPNYPLANRFSTQVYPVKNDEEGEYDEDQDEGEGEYDEDEGEYDEDEGEYDEDEDEEEEKLGGSRSRKNKRSKSKKNKKKKNKRRKTTRRK